MWILQEVTTQQPPDVAAKAVFIRDVSSPCPHQRTPRSGPSCDCRGDSVPDTVQYSTVQG